MLTTLTLVILQVQLTTGLEKMEKKVEVVLKPRYKFQLEMVKLLLFDRDLGKVVLQTQDLRVSQVNKSCIESIQENSIEFLVQSTYLIYYTRWSVLLLYLAYSKDYV